MTRKEIGRAIRARRKATGLHRAAVAFRSGWGETTVSNVERGVGCGFQAVMDIGEVVGLELIIQPIGGVAIEQGGTETD